jgi:NADH-quinone oxidoreductase subunit H
MTLPSIITAQLIVNIIVCVIVIHIVLVGAGLLLWQERKLSAYVQDRIGPNRVGFDLIPQLSFLKGLVGLGQGLADGLKLFLKEDYTPRRVDKVLFLLAPGVMVIPALIGFIIIPWGGAFNFPAIDLSFISSGMMLPGGVVHVAGANFNVGVVYLLAVASLGVYGVTLGGWAANNKYSFLGGLRATAQMISYEIPMGLSILAVLLLVGSLLPEAIIKYQVSHGWLIATQPVSAVIFFIAIMAEANRAPFDNAECEQELVGGYHTEYSSMRFALFILAEYAHLIVSCAFFSLLFLGGYHLPFIGALDPTATGLVAVLAKCAVFGLKAYLLVSLMMLIRWTIPRLRYDQIMSAGWQGLIPASLLVVVVTAVMVYLDLRSLPLMLLANVGVLVVILAVQPILPKNNPNKRVQLYGSRFSPMDDERVRTQSAEAMALADRPEHAVAR